MTKAVYMTTNSKQKAFSVTRPIWANNPRAADNRLLSVINTVQSTMYNYLYAMNRGTP